MAYFTAILTILAALQQAFLPRNPQPTVSSGEPSLPCLSKDCFKSAAELMNSLNRSVSPCEDFYRFSCGGWMRDNPMPENRHRWDQFEILEKEKDAFLQKLMTDKELRAKYSRVDAVQKAFTYYDSCVDQETRDQLGGEPLKKLIHELGSWPITDKQWRAESWDFTEASIKIHRKVAIGSFFTLFTSPDRVNSSGYVLNIRPSALLGLDLWTLLDNSPDSIKRREAYRNLTITLTRALGADNGSIADVDDIMDLELKVAKAMPKRLYDPALYKKLTIRQLNEYIGTDTIDWLQFLRRFYDQTDVKITEDMEVVVLGLDALRNAVHLIGNTTKRALANYMVWRVAEWRYSLLGKEFTDIYYEFRSALASRPIQRDDPKEMCRFLALNKYFGTALSRPYVQELFDEKRKQQARRMVNNIRDTFVATLHDLDWMDPKTKSSAKEKAEKMRENIGYPDYILDERLNKEYEEVKCREKKYFENGLGLSVFYDQRDLARLGTLVDSRVWHILPSDINAHYNPFANKMVFPAAILQPPFYAKYYSRAMLYGGIGTIMGHELTHGFDEDGKLYDHNGDGINWWSNETLQLHNEKTQCLVNQYSNFTFAGGKINGKNTLSENMADNGGLKQAFKAYKEWVKKNGPEPRLPGVTYTAEQIFFISFARNFCSRFSEQGAAYQLWGQYSPAPWRVKGTLMNSCEFAEAFKCPIGSPMNPEDKCVIW